MNQTIFMNNIYVSVNNIRIIRIIRIVRIIRINITMKQSSAS